MFLVLFQCDFESDIFELLPKAAVAIKISGSPWTHIPLIPQANLLSSFVLCSLQTLEICLQSPSHLHDASSLLVSNFNFLIDSLLGEFPFILLHHSPRSWLLINIV